MKRDDYFASRLHQDVTDVEAKGEAGVLREMDADLRQADADCAALVVTPHPLTLQGQRILDARGALLLPGDTLAEFLNRHGVLAGHHWVVSLGGVDVPELMWQRVRPKPGHLIEARRVPEGGGFNDALRFVAVVGLLYVTGGIAAGGISALGITGGSFAAALAAGVVGLAGSIVINRLLGPAQPQAPSFNAGTTSPTYSLSGGRNRARPFEPMGLVLGEPYCVPDLAAQPYTYFANGEQYLWQLFHAGINCASVSTLRIGQTPIENYQGVSLGYEGFAAGNTGLPLLSNVDTIAGALLDAPGAAGAWVTRTSSVNTIELAVDIEGTLFSVNQESGAYENLLCIMEIEYRLVGDAAWSTFYITPPYTTPMGGYTTFDDIVKLAVAVTLSVVPVTPTAIELRNANTKPVRQTFRRQVPAGQYEVRARKVTPNTTASNQQNTIQWSTLKSYQLDTGSYKGQARLGVQVQASGQLSGSLDEVNWQAVGKPMPYWDGAAWVTATTRANGLSNPGAQILQLARGIYDQDGRLLAGLGWADVQIDIDSLKLFMAWCAAKGFTFDYFLQETMSIGDLLEAIAAAGMGAISHHTGKLGVIWFSDEQPVESVLNMGTIKAKSFSVDYNTQATADEIEFQYFDRDRNNTWKSVRVLAPGVAVPTNTARHPLTGVTTEAHAAVLARFSMAQNVYQRKTVNSEVDLEHLTFRRGTVMAISHDLTQWGYGGRVQEAANAGGTVTLTLDDVVPAVGPSGQTARYVGLRIPGESQYRVFPVQAFAGNSRTLTLASAWPAGVPVPGDSAANPAWDTIWIYDFKATPGQKVRVASVEPAGNLGGARVALVPESAEFWNYVWTGGYTPPPNNSLLQGAPVVTRVTMNEQLARQGNTYYTELTATIEVTGSYERAELWGIVGAGEKRLLATTQGTRLDWRGGLDETWNLEVRPYRGIGAGTPYVFGYTVSGLAAAPPDVTEFKIDGARLGWLPVSAVDLAGYQIRFNYGQNTWWPTAAALHDGLITDTPYTMQARPAGVVTLLIKAVDTSGNESANAAAITVNLGDPLTSNILLEWPQAPAFSGTITGGAVSAGVLQAAATDLFYGPDAEPFYGSDTDPFYPASTYADMTYEFEVVATAPGTLVLLYTVTASQWLIECLRDSQAAFYGADSDYFYGPDAEPFFGPPGQWAVWPGAIDLAGAEAIRFRVSTAGGSVRGQASLLTVQLDVPDVTEQLNDIVISAAGTRLPITQAYRFIQNVQLTVQADGNGGITPRIKDKNATLGPLVEVLNSAGTAVIGLVDADIQGY